MSLNLSQFNFNKVLKLFFVTIAGYRCSFQDLPYTLCSEE